MRISAAVLSAAFICGALIVSHERPVKDDNCITAYAGSEMLSGNAGAQPEIPDGKEVVFTGNSMTLGGAVSLNFYVNYGDIPEANYADTYIEFDVNGSKQRADFDPAKMNRTRTDYCFNCKLNAVSMADEVRADFHYIDKSGNAQTLTAVSSAEDYLRRFSANDEKKVWDLIRAINDYGYYMQFYLSYYAGEPWQLGVDHKAMQAGYTVPSFYKDEKNLSAYISGMSSYKESEALNRDIESVTKGLILDSDTVLYLGIKPAQNYKGNVSISVDDKPADVIVRSDGVYEVRIRGISAHKLGDFHTVKIKTDRGTSTVRASAMSYAYSCVKSPLSDSELYAMCALYDYYSAARAYKKSDE
ncbi:hypothetical protein [uncultured Ruminococcus sp.]|uniref:hypothetical protein n=1 Tax=uncultured Ruminococcus sp. TaxID=165186 RepID=UPI00260E49B5|nr:hypothetical protein [uncultured Ruminococcus sp.]